MWEETLGFFVLLVPLALALGYDRMVAAAIIFLGAGSGVIASTVNPFATGVASDAAGITIGDGIGLRIALWVVLVPLAIGVRPPVRAARPAHPEKSVVGVSARTPRTRESLDHRRPCADRATEARAGALRRDVPADDLRLHPLERPLAGGRSASDFPLPTFHDFYFPEAAGLFIVMAVVIGLIARLGEEGTVTTIVAGAVRLPRRGIDHRGRPRDHGRDEERLHDRHDPALDGERGLGHVAAASFAILAFIVNLPIAFLVPSSSGHAALVMPILAPLADFAGVSRAIAVTASSPPRDSSTSSRRPRR